MLSFFLGKPGKVNFQHLIASGLASWVNVGELGGGDSELAKVQNRQLPSKLRRLLPCLLATNGDNHLRKKSLEISV